MKKQILILVCFLLVCSLAACNKSGSQASKKDNPPLVENPKTDFEYEQSKEGDAIYITKYIGTAVDVVIPAEIDGLPVTWLKDRLDDGVNYVGVFQDCNIQSVVIPDSVNDIGTGLFRNCTELKEVTLSKNLWRISNSAFNNCPKLQKIDLSKTKVTLIDNLAFRDCTGLTQVKLPDSLEQIGGYAFAGCTSLKSITIPPKLELFSLNAQAFCNVPALETIQFAEGRESIIGYAFFDTTSSVEIYIPKSVKTFNPETFFLRGPAKIIFAGDCPEIKGKTTFYGEPTICYDPKTDGWDSCVWKGQYSMEPSA